MRRGHLYFMVLLLSATMLLTLRLNKQSEPDSGIELKYKQLDLKYKELDEQLDLKYKELDEQLDLKYKQLDERVHKLERPQLEVIEHHQE